MGVFFTFSWLNLKKKQELKTACSRTEEAALPGKRRLEDCYILSSLRALVETIFHFLEISWWFFKKDYLKKNILISL